MKSTKLEVNADIRPPQRVTTLVIRITGPQAGGKSLVAQQLVTALNSAIWNRFSDIRSVDARHQPELGTEGDRVIVEIRGRLEETGGDAIASLMGLKK